MPPGLTHLWCQDETGKLPVKNVWEAVTRHNLVSQYVGKMLKEMRDPDGNTDYRAFVERLRLC